MHPFRRSLRLHRLRFQEWHIPLLFRKFAADVAVQYKMPAIALNEEARTMLENYYWRGNIRQLKNVAEQISAIEESRDITPQILAKYLADETTATSPSVTQSARAEDMNSERELLYKILFDMRSDINDLKRMLSDLMRGTQPVTPAPTQGEVFGLLPSSSERDEVVDYAESEEVVEMPHRELTKADIQREQVLKALRNHNGCRRDAARELFMSERTLYRRIKDLGITDDEI